MIFFEVYDLLSKIEFSSERKRMSIIVRDPNTKKIIIFCKGADSVILPKLNENSLRDLTKAKEHLKTFSKEVIDNNLFLIRSIIEKSKFLIKIKLKN